MANYFGTGMGRGKTGAAYSSTLWDIRDIESQQEASNQMADIKQAESDRIFGAVQKGISLFSQAMGMKAGQEEAAGQISEATGGKAVQTVGETKITDLLNPFKKGEGGKIEWEGFGKAPGLGKGETAWGEAAERIGTLFGDKQREWTLEEEVGGIEAGTYTQSDLLTRAKVSKYEKMGLDLSGKSKIDLFYDDNSDDERWPRNEDTYDSSSYEDDRGAHGGNIEDWAEEVHGDLTNQEIAEKLSKKPEEGYGPQEEEPWRNWTLGGL